MPSSRAAIAGCLILAAGCAGEDDPRPPRWSFISRAIIAPNCATASCHSEMAAVAGVELEDIDTGYRILVHNPAMGGQGLYVLPGEPDRSKLMFQLRGDGTLRMPLANPLPAADIALIECWILEGAQKD